MTAWRPIRDWCSALAMLLCLAAAAAAQEVPLPTVLDRASQRVSGFLDQFSNVKCVEQVTQTKLRPNGKVELEETSSFDYLVILTNAGGEVSLNESRLPLKESTADRKKNISMLLSNGFATLFLIFHPYYAGSFEFTDAGGEVVEGHSARRLHFVHTRNTRSIAALALRGREYPLELSGDAWVEPETGDILRMDATIGSTLEDVGMKSLNAAVRFTAVSFSQDQAAYWFPSEAVVEVETPRQHWRNTHRFISYKQFSVSTEEHVKPQ